MKTHPTKRTETALGVKSPSEVRPLLEKRALRSVKRVLTGVGLTSEGPIAANSAGALKFAQLPAWQIERAELLQRACQSVQRRMAGGQAFGKAVRIASWTYRGRVLKTAPRKTLRLSRVTLIRLFPIWKKNPTPSAFRLNY